jgi:phosphomannomutase
MVHAAVMSGLLAGGCKIADLGVVSTPGAALMVRELGAAGGMMITASHNPVIWNGIKFITQAGSAPAMAEAEAILDRYRSRRFSLVPVEGMRGAACDESTAQRHVDLVMAIVRPEQIRERRYRVVLDSVCGAGGAAGRRLLESLGCHVTHLNAEPTGQFPHPPEPLAENLTGLADAVARERADVGFAQDPDADRLAIVDEGGRYIGEEFTLALAAHHVFSTRPGPAVANLSTSRMIDDLAARSGGGCRVWRSAVGEANVVEVMREKGAVIGGEGNGGVIDPRVVYVRDSLVAMALTLQSMTNLARPLSAIVAELPRYHMIKEKFECDRERIAAALAAVKAAFAGERMNDADGVRIDWPEGWIHVRGSNTEPIMRVIAEAEDAGRANSLIARVRRVINSR